MNRDGFQFLPFTKQWRVIRLTNNLADHALHVPAECHNIVPLPAQESHSQNLKTVKLITFDKEKHSLKTPVTLTFLFALLCLLELNVPLNGDEAKTYLEHVASSPFQLLFQYAGPNRHTLFSILSNTSMRILGEHEVAFRTPVFLAAILSIFLIHRLGQSLWNSTTATVASLLLMGSYHHLICDQSG